MSYTLAYKGAEIDEILGRAATGGALDTAIAAKQDALTFDAVPTQGSTNPAESGGIYDAIQAGGAAALAAFPTDSVSGDVVSFPDGADSIPVKSFTGSIVPIQDLHGQSAPYPAGGGKNKINSEATSATHNGITYTVNSDYIISASGTASGGLSVKNIINGKTLAQANLVEGTSYILNGCPSGGSASGYYLRLALTTSGGTTNYTDTGSGVTFTVPSGVTSVRIYIGISVGVSVSNLVFKPMIRLATEADATFAPYANICPISGWTGANITRAGRNLFDKSTATDGEWIAADGTIGYSGTFSLSDYIRIAGESVTISGNNGWGSSPAACFFDRNKNYISGIHPTTRPVTLTIPEGAAWLRSSLPYASKGTFQIELGDTATDYEDYQADTITIQFGQTVYAGTLTSLGGGLWKVQPTHAYIANLKDLAWTYTSGATYPFKAPITGGKNVTGNTSTPDVRCTMYKTTSALTAASTDYCIGGLLNGTGYQDYLTVKDTRYTDVATFKAAIDGQSALYALATLPDPIIVSASDLQTLLGSNSVWTDVGSVTGMTYRADTALYIQKLLNGGGTLQALSMASPSPSLSLGRVGVLAEPEEAEPEQTDEEAEQLEQTEEPEQTEEA